MTKPIEGWVHWKAGRTLRMYFDTEEEARRWILPSCEKGWQLRPVRITFTDEETPEQRKERVCNMSRAELEEALNELSVEPIALTQAATSCTTPVYVQSSIGNETIEDGVEDNEFNRGLKAMADYVESLAPELNGYIELEEGQKIENALKKDRERIWGVVSNGLPGAVGVGIEDSDMVRIKKEIFGEEK